MLTTGLAVWWAMLTIQALASGRVGSVLLLADRSEPILKAVFLSTAQDKALLVRRTPNLFDPAAPATLGKERAPARALVFGRVVNCYEPAVR